MKPGYFVFFALFLICLAVRLAYEILKKIGKISPTNRALVAVVFAAMCILWISWFAMCPADPLHITLPGIVRWSGFAIFAVGLVLAVGALFQLKGVENIDHLVTTGLFARVRHPMYLGFIFWIVGWGIYHAAIVSFIAGGVGIANILYWRHLEEVHLQRTWGDKYLAYRKRTWF